MAEAIKAAGVKVPTDTAIAGFDDLPWTSLMTPDITVMRQPTNEIAAIRLVPERAVRRVVLRGELLVRGSTQPSSGSIRPTCKRPGWRRLIPAKMGHAMFC